MKETELDVFVPLRVAERVLVAAFVSLLCVFAVNVDAAALSSDPEVRSFIAEMETEHGFARGELEGLMNEAKIVDSILEAISRPAEGKPWYEYRQIFLKPNRIEGGAAFWNEHADTLLRAEAQFGVPAEIVVAIIGVETLYGRYRGKHRVLDALATLGFRYPKRSKFFRSELKQYLLLMRQEGLDPRSFKGSYAGAMGIPQFIPSSYRAYAVDFDGDNIRDLIGSVDDAIGSVANYLAVHGWRRGQSIVAPAKVTGKNFTQLVERGLKPITPVSDMQGFGVDVYGALPMGADGALLEFELRDGVEYWVGINNFYMITRYNHSQLYAMAVYQLAEAIKETRDAQ